MLEWHARKTNKQMIPSMAFIINRDEHDVIPTEKLLFNKKTSTKHPFMLLKTFLNSFLHYCD